MRVLHVYSGNMYGGVETMLATLACQRNVWPLMQPQFGLCFEGHLSRELVAAGVPVHLFGSVRVSRPQTVRRARRALRTLLRREHFDVVICHSAWSQAIFGPAVRSAGLPLVFWMHDATEARHWLEWWARLTPPDLVVCNSRFTASKLPKLYPHVRGEVVYSPAAPPELCFSKADREVVRRELNTPADAVVIIQASRMESWKGHVLLLEALGVLRDLPGWVCWQVGRAQRPFEVQYLEGLKSTAAQLGIADRVHFLGWQPDLRRLLAAADIHCQPNFGPEPLGLAFIEALFAGLPVVTTKIGGAQEVVDQSCGILVPPEDAGELAAVLRRLVEDPALRTHLGAAGPTRARSICDPETRLRQLYTLLDETATVSAGGFPRGSRAGLRSLRNYD